MIRRTMEAGFLNSVMNHDGIRPHIGGDVTEPIDLTDALANPANYGIEADGGGWYFHPILPGVMEVHTALLPSGRGALMFKNAREAMRYMFTRTDCLEIVTKCPDDNPGARMASAQLGFRERFRREDAWAPGVGISYRVFSLDDWMVRDKECLAAGRAFHESLEAAKQASGSELPVHPDDEAHDRVVGAAFLMIQAGNAAKGVAVYCRWAVFAGYAPIAQVGLNTFDVGDAVVELIDGQMSVLLTR